MKGTYIFKQNGKEIARSSNIITDLGKQQIAKSLAFQNTQWASRMAIGAGSTSESVSDIFLNFEYARSDIKSISSQQNTPTSGKIRLAAKALLTESVSGKIYEVGIFSSSVNPDAFEIPIFQCLDNELWDAVNDSLGTLIDTENLSPSPHVSAPVVVGDGYSYRIGDQSLYFGRVNAFGGNRTVRISTNQDFSEVGYSDNFLIAYYKPSSAGSSMLTVKFCQDANNYFSKTITTSSTGYIIDSSQKSLYTASGASPSWDAITYIEITSNNQYVYLDGMRVKRSISDDQNVLVSRSVLSSPVTKIEGTPLEIEYYLDLF